MPKLILIVLFQLCYLLSNSQDWVAKINDSDFKSRLSLGLKVGDSMPDISFGEILNNPTGFKKVSDLKGKLIILDFWNTWCASCIAGFPKMEKLQSEFGDKVQIILVNPFQTKEEIINASHKIKFPNLPSVVKDNKGNGQRLLDLFPARSTGHQVWIDSKGIVRLRGASFNNYYKKIDDFLNGRPIYMLKDNGTAPIFDSSYPYHKLLGEFATTPMQVGSVITLFNNEYEPENTGIAINQIDSVSGTYRNTFVNFYVLDLYSHALDMDEIIQQRKMLLFGPTAEANAGPYGYHFFKLPKDTLRYTGEFTRRLIIDSEYIKPRICFEQVVPISYSEEVRKKYMLEDLNRYFSNKYNTLVRIVKRKTPCYLLIRSSTKDKIAVRNNTSADITEKKVNGQVMRNIVGVDLSIIGEFVRENKFLRDVFLNNFRSGDRPYYIFNETGFDMSKKISLIVPANENIRSIEDLRVALLKYDLDIKEEDRDLYFVELTDNSF